MVRPRDAVRCSFRLVFVVAGWLARVPIRCFFPSLSYQAVFSARLGPCQGRAVWARRSEPLTRFQPRLQSTAKAKGRSSSVLRAGSWFSPAARLQRQLCLLHRARGLGVGLPLRLLLQVLLGDPFL